jgi:hypothetical protein
MSQKEKKDRSWSRVGNNTSSVHPKNIYESMFTVEQRIRLAALEEESSKLHILDAIVSKNEFSSAVDNGHLNFKLS